MKPEEKSRVFKLISAVYAFYRQDTSEFALGVWWQAVQPFDYEAVADALNRHCVNPDNGQFMPKPADMVKMLQGSTKDSALVAWAKVDKGIRQIGTYATVAFDDPIIHAVIQEMGGWVGLGTKDEKEWPYIRNEFENRYRGYKTRNDVRDYPKALLGIAQSQNEQSGFPSDPPVLIGNPEVARKVLENGSDRPAIGFTRMASPTTLQIVDADEEAA
jgi:hypothetical protein